MHAIVTMAAKVMWSFFVAGGDAAKSFESGEESFDAVALNLEVVIERLLNGAVCFWGE
jgi:hypothetical protein